jgi:hypothetical protein
LFPPVEPIAVNPRATLIGSTPARRTPAKRGALAGECAGACGVSLGGFEQVAAEIDDIPQKRTLASRRIPRIVEHCEAVT